MPSKYLRKTSRATSYTKEELEIAIRRVRNKEITNYAASIIYGIPTSTLNDRVRGRTGVLSQSLGRPPVLSIEIEARLANCLRTLEKWGWGLSKEELLDVVSKFIKQNGIQTPFKDDRPGDAWFLAFRHRHKLSVKKPQPVEYLRKRMTDPFVVGNYFTLLEEELTKLHDPHRIWNLDESSVSLDPTRTKVVGAVGRPCIRTTAGTGKEHITVLTTVNAAGGKLNPLIVFKGKNVYEQWMADKQGDHDFELAYAASKRGWMESDIFYNYMAKVVIPSLGQERPVLMIYDGHVSHVDDRVVALAVANKVTILKLPPHTSHLLQPLDLAVFKSFKSIWDKHLVQWQRENVGYKVRKQAFADMFAKAWHLTKPKLIRKGFEKGGIYPFNPNVIPIEKYDPAAYKRWQKHIYIKKSSLKKMCIDVINKSLFGVIEDNSKILKPDSKSFEELLLENLKQQPNNSGNKTATKLKKVAPGAEVITRTFLEQKEREQKNAQEEATPKTTSTNDEQIPGPSETCNTRQRRSKILTNKTTVEIQVKGKGNNKNKQGKINTLVEVQTKEKSKNKKRQAKDNTLVEVQGKEKCKNKKRQRKAREPLKNKSKAKKRKRSSSFATTSESMEVSVHSDSDILDALTDKSFDSDIENFDAFINDNTTEIYQEYDLSREKEIDKNIKEITKKREENDNVNQKEGDIVSEAEKRQRKFKTKTFTDNEEILAEKQKVEQCEETSPLPVSIPNLPKQIKNTRNRKINILESISITPENMKNTQKIKIVNSDYKVINKNFDVSTNMKNDVSFAQNLRKNCSYNVGELVLARYYKKTWKHYIGVIEKKNSNTGHYTINFYKTIGKKEKARFVLPKYKDEDIVPPDNIVKEIKLLQISDNPPQYVLMNEEDGMYF